MKYERPYCASCKLIWGYQSIGRVLNCRQCGKPLTLKSFNPWLSALGGLGVIAIGGLTLAIRHIPIIWIGGFLFGGSLIINGLRQWFEIKELDAQDNNSEARGDRTPDDSQSIVITCGQCATEIRLKRGQGVTTTTCPGCKRQSRVKT